jgi:hypothetical protein
LANFDFSRLRDIERIAGDRMDQVVRGTLLDLSRRIVLRTPVGNPSLWQGPPPPGYTGGQARGNWQASIGSPSSGTTTAIDKTGTPTITSIAGETQNAPGNVWYLTNNLPYISILEHDGWSTQAKEGMVRISLRELDRSIDEQIANLSG